MDLFPSLPKSIQKICGQITFPPDDGDTPAHALTISQQPMYGSANASLKDGNASHACTLYTGNPVDINYPLLRINGTGPIDGHDTDLSSSRVEMQSQVAVATAANLFFSKHKIPTCHNRCTNNPASCLKHHRHPNIDLYLQHKETIRGNKFTFSWVKSHQDNNMEWDTLEELHDLKLGKTAPFNAWCNRNASVAQQSCHSNPETDIFPAEKWAVFLTNPVTRKVTGNLASNLMSALSTNPMKEYIRCKHKILMHHLDCIHSVGLQKCMMKVNPHSCASI
jgi:hypothetical protein